MSEFREWAILELMGHRRLAGEVSETEIGGAKFIRIDVPGKDGTRASQFYSPAAVYCITPTSEETAHAFALRNQPAPISRWDLPANQIQAPSQPNDDDHEGENEDDDDRPL